MPDAMHLIKFSSEDWACHRMSHYDSAVAQELGLEFVSVMLQDTVAYRAYRTQILLKQYPNKEGMGWPTYLLVTDPGRFHHSRGTEGRYAQGGLPAKDCRRCFQPDSDGGKDLNPQHLRANRF